MRTNEEVLERFESVDDFMGIQKVDLIGFLEYEKAKPFLNDDHLAKVESGHETWEAKVCTQKDIIEYLPFAFDKAHNERGLSAGRSILHFTTWVWFDDPDFFEEIKLSLENYSSYGLPQLNKIADHYGYTGER